MKDKLPITITQWYDSGTCPAELRKHIESDIYRLAEVTLVRAVTQLTKQIALTSRPHEDEQLQAVKTNSYIAGYISAFEDLKKLTQNANNKKARSTMNDEWSHIQ